MSRPADSNPGALTAYLHEHIPMTAAMGVEVLDADPARLVLKAPLAPNINHRGGVFGGSIATLALTAAWLQVYLRTRDHDPAPTVMIARQQVDYRQPLGGDFVATCEPAAASAWAAFDAALARRGRGRIELAAVVRGTDDEATAARFEGRFVALGAKPGGRQG